MFGFKKTRLAQSEERLTDGIKTYINEGMIEGLRSELHSVLRAKDSITSLNDEITGLRRQIANLEAEAEAIKSKRRVEEAETKHLLKMKEEKNALEAERKHVDLIAEFQKKEMDLLKEHQQKCVDLMNASKVEMQAIYQQILSRLPNVNMSIRQRTE